MYTFLLTKTIQTQSNKVTNMIDTTFSIVLVNMRVGEAGVVTGPRDDV
jgi:hypothetical protein